MKAEVSVFIVALVIIAQLLPDIANAIAIVEFTFKLIDAFRHNQEERRNFERLRKRLPTFVI